jgi:hypothetical protein
MSIRRPNNHEAERVVFFYDHASKTADEEIKLFKVRRKFVVEQVRYVNPTGLAADAANFFHLKINNGATEAADWSTETGQEGTVAADTFVDFTLSSVDGARVFDADDVLSIQFDETGTATLPAGRIQIEGRYIQ